MFLRNYDYLKIKEKVTYYGIIQKNETKWLFVLDIFLLICLINGKNMALESCLNRCHN